MLWGEDHCGNEMGESKAGGKPIFPALTARVPQRNLFFRLGLVFFAAQRFRDQERSASEPGKRRDRLLSGHRLPFGGTRSSRQQFLLLSNTHLAGSHRRLTLLQLDFERVHRETVVAQVGLFRFGQFPRPMKFLPGCFETRIIVREWSQTASGKRRVGVRLSAAHRIHLTLQSTQVRLVFAEVCFALPERIGVFFETAAFGFESSSISREFRGIERRG